MKRIDSSEDATVDMEKSVTPFVSAGGPASLEKDSLMSKHYTKQGHVICGCCCDARRASIIIDLISLIFLGAAIFLVYEYNVEIVAFIDQAFGHDDERFYAEMQNDLELILEEYDIILLVVLTMHALFALLGLFGALCYNKDMVVATALFYCLLGAITVLSFSGLSLLVFPLGFFAYPHFVLFQEIGEGIMSSENYENEKHSCCCVYSDRKKLTIKQAIEKRVGIFS